MGNFERLRQIAAADPDLFGELYDYVHEHAQQLADLSYQQLSPAGALAIADWHFEQQQFDSAVPVYQQLKADNPRVIKAQADRVWLNLAYVENSRQNWPGVLALLSRFSSTFPRSVQLDKAAALYYRAAVSAYRQPGSRPGSKSRYKTYISATQNYVKHCSQCPGVSDANFELGQYYLRRDQAGQAIAAFGRVRRDSGHYFVASYYVAAGQMAALDAAARGEPITGRTFATSRYRKLGELVKQYRGAGVQSAAAKPLRPNWALLTGRYHLYGSAPNFAAALAAVDNFDSRFPQAAALQPEVLAVRAAAHQGRGQQVEFAAQVHELGKLAADNKRAQITLRQLAGRFYAAVDSDGQPATSVNAALVIYKQLLSTSATDDLYLLTTYARAGRLYRLSNREAEAVRLYQQWLDRDRDSADALLALGETYVEMAQWQNAIEVWRRLSSGLESGSEPWFQARYQTAIALQQLNRGDRACTIARMTRVLHPDSYQPFAEQFALIEQNSCTNDAAVTTVEQVATASG